MTGSAFAMIARCFERQWAGLPEAARRYVTKFPGVGFWPEAKPIGARESIRPLWTLADRSDLIAQQRWLLSIKADVFDADDGRA